MLARLRLLLAMALLCLGTWFAALALEGYVPGATLGSQSGASSNGLSASPDAQQFISFLTRERFVVEAAPTTKPQVKSPQNSRAKSQATSQVPSQAPSQVPSQALSQVKPQAKSQLEAKSPQGTGDAKPVALEKRRAASTAQLPWPLSLFGE
ncbi:MAG TPA: hypothetical protein VMR94_03985 [Hyphomicrobiaceae bacterium]|nr:hypothetical protein [Hyphomicrobiaceae bacterium]